MEIRFAFDFKYLYLSHSKLRVVKEFPQKPTFTSLRDLGKYMYKSNTEHNIFTKYSSRLATVNDWCKKILVSLSLNLQHLKELHVWHFLLLRLHNNAWRSDIVSWNLIGTCMKAKSANRCLLFTSALKHLSLKEWKGNLFCKSFVLTQIATSLARSTWKFLKDFRKVQEIFLNFQNELKQLNQSEGVRKFAYVSY